MSTSLSILPPAAVARDGLVTHPTSLTVPPGLSWEDLWRIEPQFRFAERGLPWWRGDFYNAVAERYPDRFHQYVEAQDLTSNQTIANCMSVCAHVPAAERRMTLSYTHHAIVAYQSREVRDRLLDLAERHGWGCHQLRKILHETLKQAEENETDTPQAAPEQFIPLDVPVTVAGVAAVVAEHLSHQEVYDLIDELTALTRMEEA